MGSASASERAEPDGAPDPAPATEWTEPGGDPDPANPALPLPRRTRVVDKGNEEFWRKRGGGGGVSDAEIAWMAQQRELVLSTPQLARDYGEEEAAEILAALA